MKIVHLCLACFYIDGYGYQENLLPRYHARMGHDVSIIASTQTFDRDGRPAWLPGAMWYVNGDGIPVRRLAYRLPQRLNRVLKSYRGTCAALCEAAPDVLFIHGCQFLDVDAVVRYAKRHPELRVYVDNHADFSNSARNPLSRIALHGGLWKRAARKLLPHARKFYGVLPSRVDFLRQVYGVPAEKVELLPMGVDSGWIRPGAAERARASLGLPEGAFLIVTGGKLDGFKRQTLLLMQAVRALAALPVYLVVFGSVAPELRAEAAALCDGERVRHVGWLDGPGICAWLGAAELAAFPGRHSVLWEQAAGVGTPLLCGRQTDVSHISEWGGVVTVDAEAVEPLRSAIAALFADKERYRRLKEAALRGRSRFTYAEIARRSIEEGPREEENAP
ncbi:MAG: glycosyltransferase family 4 protein [Clostridia bacterium]|nr:glycosyltransferase family 4 protein [Clostridia bacterium]